MDVIVFPQQAMQIQSHMETLIAKTNSQYVLLSHVGGSVVAESGTVPPMDSSMLAALAAGTYSSTTTMAQVLGESGFKTIEYIGENKAVAVVPINSHLILIFLFASPAIPLHFRDQVHEFLPTMIPAVEFIGQSSRLG